MGYYINLVLAGIISIPKSIKQKFDNIALVKQAKKHEAEILELEEKKYQQALTLLEEGVFEEHVKEVAELEEKKFQQALKLVKENIYDHNLFGLANLEENDFKRALQLKKRGIETEYIELMVSLSPEQFEEAERLIKEQTPPVQAIYIAKTEASEKELIKQLIKDKVDVERAYTITTLDKETKEKCLALLKKGVEDESVVEIASLTGEAEKRVPALIRMNIGDFNIVDFAKFSNEDYIEALKMLQEGIISDYISDILAIKHKESTNEEFEELIKKGYGQNSAFSISTLPEGEKEGIELIIDRYPEVEDFFRENYDVQVVILQNQERAELLLSKEYTNESGTKITLVQIFDTNGKILKSRMQESTTDGSTSFLTNNSGTYKAKYNKQGTIKELTQTILDKKTGEVKGIIHSKASKLLDGCYEAQYFDIDEIKTTTDPNYIMEKDKFENTVKTNGKTLAFVRENADGSITFDENWEKNGFYTHRHYTEKVDNNTNLLTTEYSYTIKTKDNKAILDINNYFQQISNTSAINIINGNEYKLTYDNEQKIITIQSKNKIHQIDLNKKLGYYAKDTLWEISKKLDVDTLLAIDRNIKQWNYCQDEDSVADSYYKSLFTGKNTAIIRHEVGHLIEYEKQGILENKELIDIYTKEMNLFEETVPYNEQEFIEYFSPRAAFCDVEGLNEFIAETNTLLGTYGFKGERLRTRSQFLVRYFPETIAKIAELLGKNSRMNLL